MGKSRNISNAEDRYVNVAGDTMIGTLNVDGTGQVRGYADASDSITGLSLTLYVHEDAINSRR